MINSGLPPSEVLMQLCEFARSPGTFWTKSGNTSYLVDVFIEIVDKSLQRDLEPKSRLFELISLLLSSPVVREHSASLTALQDRLR